MRTVPIHKVDKESSLRYIAEKCSRLFLISAAFILLITGLAKIISACGHARILEMKDPILTISFRYLMLLSGAIELLISGTSLFLKAPRLNLMAIAWIAAIFLSYRTGLYYIHWNRPCPCLGNLTDLLHISPTSATKLTAILAVYLFAGSLLCWTWLQSKHVLR